MPIHRILWSRVPAFSLVCVGLARAQSVVHTLHGGAADEHFGWAVADVGDVDNDGTDDFAVGAPLADSNGTDAGTVRVYSGKTLQVVRTWNGLGTRDYFGYALAKLGDLDGDGFDDVLVGAPEMHLMFWFQYKGPGYAQVISGQTGVVLHHFTGPDVDSGLGYSVASGGDIDGDLVPDLLLGGPNYFGNGRLRVISGASGGLVREHVGSSPLTTAVGMGCAILGDVNGDGLAEYAVGAPLSGNFDRGSVLLYDGATGAQLWRVDGSGDGHEFGWGLARVDDQNGNGYPDLLVFAHRYGCWPSWDCGAYYVGVLDGATSATIRSHPWNGGFAVAVGYSLADVGDVDGDGVDDYAGGAPAVEPGGLFGQVQPTRVWSGANGAEMLTLAPATYGDSLGISLARTDGNGDGLVDLLIGEPLADTAGVDSGSVHVFNFVRKLMVYCSAKTNSLGCTPAIQGVGVPSATVVQPFRIKAFQVLNNKNGLLFYSFTPQSVPFQGGALCMKLPVTRCDVLGSGGNPPPNDCSGFYSYEFNDRIRSGIDPLLVAGEEVFAQYWARDPGDTFTTSLSDALAFFIHP